MKKPVKKEWHTSDSQIGSGDFYGVGIRNKVGKPREIMGMKPLGKDLKTPPKKLA